VSLTACVSNAHAPFLGARLLLGDLVCRGVETITLPAYRRASASQGPRLAPRCTSPAERVYEVRAADRATPSIRATVAPSLTLAEARSVAREIEARHGHKRVVSIYNTATRQAVA
jgi:hypothetical protein